MEYKNLTVIGTSHISKESIAEVKAAINRKKPAIVAVELDANRYHSIKSRKKAKISFRNILQVGLVGFMFSVLGSWAQKKLGNIVGVMPGSEMLAAIRQARESKAEIKLIDQDIGITLKRLSSAITWREELRFVLDIIMAVISPKREIRKLGIEGIDLSKVPSNDIIGKLMASLKKKYPNVYRVLVAERNIIMARRLAYLMSENAEKEIVAVVGAGHEDEIIDIVRKIEKNRENEHGVTYSFTVK